MSCSCLRMKRCPRRPSTSSIYGSPPFGRTNNSSSARRWGSTTTGFLLFVAFAAAVLHQSMAFQPSPTRPMPSSAARIPRRSLSRRYVVTDREPDVVEMLVGGEKYELVPLPDRMIDTTIFVGKTFSRLFCIIPSFDLDAKGKCT